MGPILLFFIRLPQSHFFTPPRLPLLRGGFVQLKHCLHFLSSPLQRMCQIKVSFPRPALRDPAMREKRESTTRDSGSPTKAFGDDKNFSSRPFSSDPVSTRRDRGGNLFFYFNRVIPTVNNFIDPRLSRNFSGYPGTHNENPAGVFIGRP